MKNNLQFFWPYLRYNPDFICNFDATMIYYKWEIDIMTSIQLQNQKCFITRILPLDNMVDIQWGDVELVECSLDYFSIILKPVSVIDQDLKNLICEFMIKENPLISNIELLNYFYPTETFQLKVTYLYGTEVETLSLNSKLRDILSREMYDYQGLIKKGLARTSI